MFGLSLVMAYNDNLRAREINKIIEMEEVKK